MQHGETQSNNNQQYGRVSKLLHWGSAIAILPAMAIGIWWIRTDLDTDYGWEQFESLIEWHANFGLTVIIFMLPRLVWRMFNGLPPTSLDIATLKRLAIFAHRILYALAIFTPISGWLGSALDGATFSYFSMFKIPPFLGTYPDLAVLMTAAHRYSSWLLIAFVALHLAAVVFHQFWLKDQLLRRIL